MLFEGKPLRKRRRPFSSYQRTPQPVLVLYAAFGTTGATVALVVAASVTAALAAAVLVPVVRADVARVPVPPEPTPESKRRPPPGRAF